MFRTLILALALSTAAHASVAMELVDEETEQVAGPTDHTDAWRSYLTDRRNQQIARLEAYADAGVFPLNNDSPGLVNIFMDEEGRRCAMANLIWQDGNRGLVKRTARTNNALLLGEVEDGPLMDWILTSGLTQDEVAFVQEPDFFIRDDFQVKEDRQLLVAAEQTRLRAHFAAAAQQLKAYGPMSIEEAIDALGDRVQERPATERRS